MSVQENAASRKFEGEPAVKPLLLAEDNLVNQKVALVLLELLSLEAEVVNNGKEALAAVKSGSYSIILMDCHMPVMDGFQATVAIRKYEAQIGRYTPIIAVTALAMAGDRERCIAAGMDDYIAKPIDREVLQEKISHWLRSDVVFKSRNIIRKHLRADSALTVLAGAPINLTQLEEFYEPQDLREILDLFVGNTEAMLGRIKTSIEKKGHSALAKIAHELKASCSSIGAKQMSKLCLCLEQAAGQEDWLEAQETYLAIVRSFDEIRKYLQMAADN